MLQTEKAEEVVRRNPPSDAKGPAGRVGVRNMASFSRAPLGFLQHMTETYGDVVDIRIPNGRWVLFNHPSDIEAILVDHAADVGRDDYAQVLARALGKGLLTSDGELWKRQRRLSSSRRPWAAARRWTARSRRWQPALTATSTGRRRSSERPCPASCGAA